MDYATCAPLKQHVSNDGHNKHAISPNSLLLGLNCLKMHNENNEKIIMFMSNNCAWRVGCCFGWIFTEYIVGLYMRSTLVALEYFATDGLPCSLTLVLLYGM